MQDSDLIEQLYRRFHKAPDGIFADRIAHLPINDLPFTDAEAQPVHRIEHLLRGDDKSGASFDIFRLGWFNGRVWELVIIDGAYLPHIHRKINSEFFMIAGGGHLSRGGEWRSYRERTRVSIPMAAAHGFITDPGFGPTVFLSIQSDPIRKIVIDPATKTERTEDDFIYVDDVFPLPPHLLDKRRRKLAAQAKKSASGRTD